MQKKLLLIDGDSLLLRYFFKAINFNKEQKNDSQKIDTVSLMTRLVLNLSKDKTITHLAVAWSSENKILKRRKRFPLYKTTYLSFEKQLTSQAAVMQDILKAMNIQQYWSAGNESGDIIGTLTKKFEADLQVDIISTDQSLLQLVSKNMNIWKPAQQDRVINSHYYFTTKKQTRIQRTFQDMAENFRYQFKLEPYQVTDLLALKGQRSKTIPGMKNNSKNSAIPLLQTFKTLEDIYTFIKNTKRHKAHTYLKQTLGFGQPVLKDLLEQQNAVYLSRDLATVETSINSLKQIKLDDLTLNFDPDNINEQLRDFGYSHLSFL